MTDPRRLRRTRFVGLPVLLALAAAAWLAAREATLPGEHFPLGQRLVLAREADRAERWFGRPLHHGLETTLVWDLVFAAAVGAALAFGAWWFSQTYRTIDARTMGTVLGLAGGASAALQALAIGVLLIAGHAEPYASGERWQAPPAAWHLAAVAGWGAWFVAVGVAIYLIGGLLGLLTPWWVLKALYEGEDGVLPDSAGTLAPRRLGLAISGGGIRASSMALGTLQGLEIDDDSPCGWDQADKIASISGGSAMAGAWYVARQRPDVDGLKPPATDAWRLHRTGLAPEERYLRANLGFVLSSAPRGASHDRALRSSEMESVSRHTNRPGAVATALIGFAVNASVFVGIIVVLGIVSGWFYRWYLGLSPAMARWRCPGHLGYPLEQHPPGYTVPSPTATCADLIANPQPPTYHDILTAAMPGWSALAWLAVGGAGLLLWVTASRLLGALGRPDSPVLAVPKMLTVSALALSVTCLLVLSAVPAITVELWRPIAGSINVVAVLGAIGSAVGVVKTLKAPLARFAPLVAGILFAAVLLYLYVHVTALSLATGVTTTPVVIVLGIAAALGLAHLGGLNETWSLAGFYRSRLRGAFATYRRRGHAAAFDNDAGSTCEPELSTYADARLTLCATATVTGRDVVTHAGVPALSFTFTKDDVSMYAPLEEDGQWHRFSCATAEMAALMPHWSPRITTFMAVGLSSAAVSPAMGRFKVGPLSLLFTFANVRLGMWLPNPRYAAALAGRGRLPRPRLGYLLKEFVSHHDLSDLFVYVTDGGHWENTGLVELLRDGHYGEVVVVDSDSGAGNRTPSLAKAIDLARQECAATVCIDLDVFRTSPTPTPGLDYAERSVNLGLIHRPRPQGDQPGLPRDHTLYTLLWYARADLTPCTPAPLLAYRELDDTFPRTSTLHQVFSPEQFMAYRDLGRHNAAQIVTARERLRSILAHNADFGCFKERHSRHAGRLVDWTVDELVDLIEQLPAAERGLAYRQVRAALTDTRVPRPRTEVAHPTPYAPHSTAESRVSGG